MGRLVWGIHPVRELLKTRPGEVEQLLHGPATSRALAEILALARSTGVRLKPVEQAQLHRLTEGAVHQGIVAEVAEYQYAALADLLAPARRASRPPLLVLLDGISDPHNLGAIIRSAHGLGADGVVIPQDRAAGVTAVVAKASAGAVERCPIAKVVNLSRSIEELKKAGVWFVASDPKAELAYWDADLTGPLGLVIGSEGSGIRPLVRRHCDLAVRIPMGPDGGSLNASAAAALILAEIVRQRRPPNQGSGTHGLDRPRRRE